MKEDRRIITMTMGWTPRPISTVTGRALSPQSAMTPRCGRDVAETDEWKRLFSRNESDDVVGLSEW